MPRPSDVGVGTAIVVVRNNPTTIRTEILLGLRTGSHAAGVWSCPGGWLDRTDTSTITAVVRELQEETGIVVNPWYVYQRETSIENHSEAGFSCATVYHVTHVDMLANAERLEPNKCLEWRWFPVLHLPENLFPGLTAERIFRVIK